MLIDAVGDQVAGPLQIEAAATRAEADGYDGFCVTEIGHDPFVSLTLAARATRTIALQSSIAVAFARNPMSVAVLANDLQLVSGGRFQLGLGSQVKAHVERRFSMPWSRPAARMEEFVAALRAIWSAFETGERLHFRGEHYQHTLLTEFFNPGPSPHGAPPVLLAAVGRRMTEAAGRVADGVICHSLTTERYLREVTLPALRAGGAGRDVAVCLAAFAVVGDDEAERAVAEAAVRRQISFYASTPAYLPVLELHGLTELNDTLNKLSRQHAWAQMADAIDDDVLDAFAVAGTAAEVAAQLRARFGDVVRRLSLNTPYPIDRGTARAVADALRADA